MEKIRSEHVNSIDNIVNVRIIGKGHYALVMSILAVIIACASFFTTYEHNKAIRRFSKIAYSPRLNFTIHHSDGKLSIVNNGLGPANIDSLQFYHYKQFIGKNQESAWINILVDKINFDSLVEVKYQDDPTVVVARYNLIGGILPSNGRFTLFEILNLKIKSNNTRLLDDVLEEMDLHIFYRDLISEENRSIKFREAFGKEPYSTN